MTNSTGNVRPETALLPCPFCGAPADSYQATERVPNPDGSLDAAWVVDCSQCDCNMEGSYKSREEAERLWNTRPVPSEARQPVTSDDEKDDLTVAYMCGFERGKDVGKTIGWQQAKDDTEKTLAVLAKHGKGA